MALAEATGDPSYCGPITEAVQWFMNSALGPGCWARFYDFDTHTPIYIGEDGARVSSPVLARRPYRWTGDYGIPALLVRLGAKTGAMQAPPAQRLPGDAGCCPDSNRKEKGRLEKPRPRIAHAAVLLAALQSSEPSVCAAVVTDASSREIP